MVDDLDGGPRWGRIALWTGLTLVGFFVAMIALGFVAAHLDAGTGERVWRSRIVLGAAPALILIATAVFVAKKTWVPKDATDAMRREARVRRRFWGWNAAAAVFGVVTVVWLQAVAPGTSILSTDVLPTTPAVVLSLIFLIGGTAAMFVWYTRMDEVETTDNLWAGSIATTAALLIYPPWFLLSRAQLVAEPSHPALYGLLLAAYTVTYLWRKARA